MKAEKLTLPCRDNKLVITHFLVPPYYTLNRKKCTLKNYFFLIRSILHFIPDHGY